MKCEKCGAELPENVTVCPECGADNENLMEPAGHTEGADGTAIRSQTIPQRPRTAYPKRKSERGETTKKRRGKARVMILVFVIAALLCVAVFVGYHILQNGREEPDLGEPENGSSSMKNDGQSDVTSTQDPGNEDQDGEGDHPVAPATYDLAGVWVWDADTALMKETVWNFAADNTLTIHYFGLGDPENPFDAWPETYVYDKETATLTLAGEEIKLTWKNETSFTFHSEKLGICDAKKTDEAHIPTGAVDIRDVETGNPDTPDNAGGDGDTSSVYIFEDSASRYLSKAECEAHTSDELRIARNEIYARHGRLFDSEDLQAYFNAQDWYKGTTRPESFDYTVLNEYERYNVNLMKSIEDARKANT